MLCDIEGFEEHARNDADGIEGQAASEIDGIVDQQPGREPNAFDVFYVNVSWRDGRLQQGKRLIGLWALWVANGTRLVLQAHRISRRQPRRRQPKRYRRLLATGPKGRNCTIETRTRIQKAAKRRHHKVFKKIKTKGRKECSRKVGQRHRKPADVIVEQGLHPHPRPGPYRSSDLREGEKLV